MVAGSKLDASASSRTFFLPAGRASPEVVVEQVAAVSGHPLTDALLRALHGIVLVLNSKRQIVAFNRSLMVDLGFDDPDRVLGLRPGEALGCVHAPTTPAGCGTTPGCLECGAAIALLASTQTDEPVERDCLMVRIVDGEEQSIEFRARAAPVTIGEQRLTLLSLRDVREEKRWLEIDQVLLHDLLNLLAGLQATCGELASHIGGGPAGEAFGDLQHISDRLLGAAKTHRVICAAETGQLEPTLVKLPITELLGQLEASFRHSPLLEQRMLRVEVDLPDENGGSPAVLQTDRDLLLRALTNLVKNALEASPPGTTVRVWASRGEFPARVALQIHNEGEIPRRYARRIFTRYFTTKSGVGRGLGGYSTKLIVSRVLGGEVGFHSTVEAGTTFRVTLPLCD